MFKRSPGFITAIAAPALLLAQTRLPAQTIGKEAAAQDQSSQPQLVVQLGHSSFTSSISISIDGRLAVTGGDDSLAILWDVASGREIRRFVGHANRITSVAISKDNRYVATGSQDATAIIWNAETGAMLHRIVSPAGAVTALAISPDGRQLATGLSTKSGSAISPQIPCLAYLWDIATGHQAVQFKGHSWPVGSIAFSPDGDEVLMGTLENFAILWDAATGAETRRLTGHTDNVNSVAFSPDGRLAATGSDDRTARLWNVANGKELKRLAGHMASVKTVAFSADGASLATGTGYPEMTARKWGVATGKEVKRLQTRQQIFSCAFAPDGKTLFFTDSNVITRWDTATGADEPVFHGNPSSVSHVSFSPDGRFLENEAHGAVNIWDIEVGDQPLRLDNESAKRVAFSPDSRFLLDAAGNDAELWYLPAKRIDRTLEGLPGQSLAGGNFAVAFAPDGKLLVTGNNNTPRLWDAASGNELRRFSGHKDNVTTTEFSPDGKTLLTAAEDKTARLWNVETGKEIRQFQRHAAFDAAVWFSPDGHYLMIWDDEHTVTLWTVEGKQVQRFTNAFSVYPENAVAFSPDSRFILMGDVKDFSDMAMLWSVGDNKEVRRFQGRFPVVFSSDSRFAITGDRENVLHMWNVETGEAVRRFSGHVGLVWSVAFSPDGRLVASGSTDGTTRLWDAATGRELCRLISFKNGDWMVFTPDGRFDASHLDELNGLQWVMPDEPFNPLPAEIFMRDYYEPRLLARVLSGEQFKPLQAIATLNRMQPGVTITGIEPQKDSPDLATVTVKVAKATREFKNGDKKIMRGTGVYDLRLFRDGQLVAETPPLNSTTNTAAKELDLTPELERQAWREQAQVKLEANGEQTVTFTNIKLPRQFGAKPVEFAAYAFNEDRVKSRTDRKTFDLPKNLASARRRAYVLAVGVNAYENSAWDLKFAVNDARLARKALDEGLKKSGEFEEVVSVSLTSDAQEATGAKPATKANFKAALAEIARQVRPEDLVMIYYSSHGYADRSGNYYFLTADTGLGNSKEITPELLSHCVSSNELSAWLRDVDAGEIALIIDACQSGGTVKGEAGGEFKPGPMGSRGLGQLAYDKGMRILAASQADDFAFEQEELQHGLLTYALMKDGVEGRKADLDRDGQITLSETLAYALERVPKLYEAMRRGELAKLFKAEGSRGPQVVGGAASLKRKNGFQQPSLFDFAKKRGEIVLVR